jgi:hypothetical protein
MIIPLIIISACVGTKVTSVQGVAWLQILLRGLGPLLPYVVGNSHTNCGKLLFLALHIRFLNRLFPTEQVVEVLVKAVNLIAVRLRHI